MDNHERRVIVYESARNEAMDRWFNARPHITRSEDAEFIFEGGFRTAWDRMVQFAEEAAGDE